MKPFLELPERLFTTLPSAERLAFICLASSNLIPVDVVRLTLSLPARSAKTNLP